MVSPTPSFLGVHTCYWGPESKVVHGDRMHDKVCHLCKFKGIHVQLLLWGIYMHVIM